MITRQALKLNWDGTSRILQAAVRKAEAIGVIRNTGRCQIEQVKWIRPAYSTCSHSLRVLGGAPGVGGSPRGGSTPSEAWAGSPRTGPKLHPVLS